MEWDKELIVWLNQKGFHKTQMRYGHKNEYQKQHVRVRINSPKGIIILRDPEATLSITKGNQTWTPNTLRIDFNVTFGIDLTVMMARIEEFEKTLAYSYDSFCKTI
jgi:hypothetical protein